MTNDIKPPANASDIAALQQRIAALESQLDARTREVAALREDLWTLHSVIDALPYAIYWKDQNLVYRGCNQRFADDIGIDSPSSLIGKTDADLPWQPQEVAAFQAVDRRVMANDAVEQDSDETVIHADGTQEWFETYKIPLHDQSSRVAGVLATYINITERKRAEATVLAQTALLQELSTPVIPLNDQIVVMPLVGSIDTQRAQQVLETLLMSIAEAHAQVAIIDITGVPMVDTQVANALIRAAQAVQLLGAQVVLTGIRPEVAQTMVGLGVELRGITTRSSLHSGLSYALSLTRTFHAG
jgi:rsbT co-antagonist protein RsbR